MNEPLQKQETQGKTVKILLAEDNEANQFLIKAITKSQDWDITVVENGAEAVERYKTGHYDIILMDVQMPVMNGYDATRIIREIESEKGIHTPILALTAYAMKSDKDICIEAGMDDYISKPFKRQQFLDAISDVLMRFN
jgi:CheY-like chemotaxis protein